MGVGDSVGGCLPSQPFEHVLLQVFLQHEVGHEQMREGWTGWGQLSHGSAAAGAGRDRQAGVLAGMPTGLDRLKRGAPHPCACLLLLQAFQLGPDVEGDGNDLQPSSQNGQTWSMRACAALLHGQPGRNARARRAELSRPGPPASRASQAASCAAGWRPAAHAAGWLRGRAGRELTVGVTQWDRRLQELKCIGSVLTSPVSSL